MTLASRLPAFTWDRIAPLREKAGLHPDGAVDLSIGTPVDPVPGLIRDALAAASDAPGYPATWGTSRLRSAAAGWLARAHRVPVLAPPACRERIPSPEGDRVPHKRHPQSSFCQFSP